MIGEAERVAASQRSLWAEVSALSGRLRALRASQADAEPSPGAEAAPTTPEPDADESALASLCSALGLSAFERQILLLCVCAELDPTFEELAARLSSGPVTRLPTFQLVLTAFPDGDWQSLTPLGPLRHWGLIEVLAGETFLTSRLRVDEHVFHRLMGALYLDPRLQQFLTKLDPPRRLPPSYREHVERIARTFVECEGRAPLIEICGVARGDKPQLAAAACHALGLTLFGLRVSDLPVGVSERETLIRIWQRESLLQRAALFIGLDDDDDAAALRAARSIAERTSGFCFTNRPLDASRGVEVLRIELTAPSEPEQVSLWRGALGPAAAALNGELDQLATQFRLGAREIEEAAKAWLEERGARDASRPDAGNAEAQRRGSSESLWAICRERGRASLDRLATRVGGGAGWEDLVLPAEQLETLREMAAQVRQRRRVYETWNFSSWGKRGMGTSALFAGPSGTGKTLAAEVVAAELGLDLYHIDLSQIVSKFIGETEKNLKRVFDAADDCGAVLLFDEADALFGKRSEVKDSHDRYANIEVSYLLQRMEAYRGLAILTTNRRASLDPAFLRRIRFSLSFAFPDQQQRRGIWKRAFPSAAPLAELDWDRLARLTLAGGNIRNIALNAAFLAADAGEPIGMQHLLRTARSEYAKLEKPMTSAELGGWS